MTAAAPAANEPIALGILGTGWIAGEFATGVASTPAIRVMAVAGRTQASADVFAARLRIACAYAGYEALLADPTIEAVYLALPNSLHAEWAIRAAGHGKHVLCEKPLAVSHCEAQSMFAAARRAGVVLLEAFPYCFQPQTIEVLRRIRAGEIGIVRCVQASLAFMVSNTANIRMNRALAGGALMDAGCYPISFARLVFGSRPDVVAATARWGATGVDLTATATLAYQGGGLAQVACSMESSLCRSALVVGSDGVIETSYANHTAADRPAHFRQKLGTGWSAEFEIVETPSGNGFLFEAEAFARMVRGAAPGEAGAWESVSLDNAATLEMVLATADGKRV